MAITVRRLSQHNKLGLTLVAGLDGADRLITWAHAIELADPAPWLSGGELIMTTGLNIGSTQEEQFNYVASLVQAGSVALAFDTGTTFSDVPEGIRAAGDSLGFPILKVPASTPFIAITRAVIDDLTADQLRSVQKVVDQQGTFARATLRGGVPALVQALARALSSTVLVVDTEHRVLAQYGTATTRLLTSVLEGGTHGLGRQRQTSRVVGDDDGGYCMIQSVGASQELFGYLAVHLHGPMSPSDRLLTAHAVSLISIELAKPAELVEAEQRLRTSVTRLLLEFGDTVDSSLLRYFGFDTASMVSALAFTDIGALLPAERQANQVLGAEQVPYLMSTVDAELVVIIPIDVVDVVGPRLNHRLGAQLQRPLGAGVGRPVTLPDVALSVRQAVTAARAARLQTQRYVEFAKLGAFTLLLGAQSPGDLMALSDSLLAVLDDYDRSHATGGHLVTTLTAFLEHNGQTEVAAAHLSVHRHTMRNRIQKIAELLDRDLDSAHVRADLWLALQARQLLATQVTVMS
ncbi:PucR family transcriptional regulator [Rhodococcus jostii]|uniref:PucR family transcriptional regulator ligand-binding domain-containing protein n=1 Tax=Rhodococcus jostii TaxID=132919 RepID=A0ABU4CSD5_RHOJO|nr:PucR family transcriptional regulator ligand-binding domain-containing protein [Rhodococcus jostii]MDV6286496.1 PucR family transcriptional regulator ligand-binding domain-containing protein [Rhodococcus jostii]